MEIELKIKWRPYTDWFCFFFFLAKFFYIIFKTILDYNCKNNFLFQGFFFFLVTPNGLEKREKGENRDLNKPKIIILHGRK